MLFAALGVVSASYVWVTRPGVTTQIGWWTGDANADLGWTNISLVAPDSSSTNWKMVRTSWPIAWDSRDTQELWLNPSGMVLLSPPPCCVSFKSSTLTYNDYIYSNKGPYSSYPYHCTALPSFGTSCTAKAVQSRSYPDAIVAWPWIPDFADSNAPITPNPSFVPSFVKYRMGASDVSTVFLGSACGFSSTDVMFSASIAADGRVDLQYLLAGGASSNGCSTAIVPFLGIRSANELNGFSNISRVQETVSTASTTTFCPFPDDPCVSPSVLLLTGGENVRYFLGDRSTQCLADTGYFSFYCVFQYAGGRVVVPGQLDVDSASILCISPPVVPPSLTTEVTVQFSILLNSSALINNHTSPFLTGGLESMASTPLLFVNSFDPRYWQERTGTTDEVERVCSQCASMPDASVRGLFAGINNVSNPARAGTCWLDCAQVWRGHASVDDCGVCSGGDTGKRYNADMDCKGACYGVSPGCDCSNSKTNPWLPPGAQLQPCGTGIPVFASLILETPVLESISETLNPLTYWKLALTCVYATAIIGALIVRGVERSGRGVPEFFRPAPGPLFVPLHGNDHQQQVDNQALFRPEGAQQEQEPLEPREQQPEQIEQNQRSEANDQSHEPTLSPASPAEGTAAEVSLENELEHGESRPVSPVIGDDH